eukprot:scaffold105887_cov32-Prasinocladus_malaysianus.AAC.2
MSFPTCPGRRQESNARHAPCSLHFTLYMPLSAMELAMSAVSSGTRADFCMTTQDTKVPCVNPYYCCAEIRVKGLKLKIKDQ